MKKLTYRIAQIVALLALALCTWILLASVGLAADKKELQRWEAAKSWHDDFRQLKQQIFDYRFWENASGRVRGEARGHLVALKDRSHAIFGNQYNYCSESAEYLIASFDQTFYVIQSADLLNLSSVLKTTYELGAKNQGCYDLIDSLEPEALKKQRANKPLVWRLEDL